MGATSEQFSSFCFLNAADSRTLSTLTADIHALRDAYATETQESWDEAHLIRDEHIAMPERNVLESGRVYDEAINKTVKRFLCKSDRYLAMQLDSCVVGTDCLLDLIAKQEEVRTFMAMVDKKKPGEDDQYRRKLASALPEATRDALDELYDRMREFTELPLKMIYNIQTHRVEDVGIEVRRLAAEHAKFWINAADKMEEGGERDILMFMNREKSVSQQMQRVKNTIEVCIDNMPNLQEMQSEYRHSLRMSGRQD